MAENKEWTFSVLWRNGVKGRKLLETKAQASNLSQKRNIKPVEKKLSVRSN